MTTVAQMIEFLKQFPQDADVKVIKFIDDRDSPYLGFDASIDTFTPGVEVQYYECKGYTFDPTKNEIVFGERD